MPADPTPAEPAAPDGRARTGWTRGVRLGIDVGKVRVGVAKCDPDGILATPVATVARQSPDPPSLEDAVVGRVPSDLREIVRLIGEYEAVEVVIGLPVTLAGNEGLSALYVRTYAQVLAMLISPISVTLTDERMSTALASRRLSELGVRGRRQRSVVDQAAAVEILQRWLDERRRTHD
jgi:putative pre-16S rRNA nuclease